MINCATKTDHWEQLIQQAEKIKTIALISEGGVNCINELPEAQLTYLFSLFHQLSKEIIHHAHEINPYEAN